MKWSRYKTGQSITAFSCFMELKSVRSRNSSVRFIAGDRASNFEILVSLVIAPAGVADFSGSARIDCEVQLGFV